MPNQPVQPVRIWNQLLFLSGLAIGFGIGLLAGITYTVGGA